MKEEHADRCDHVLTGAHVTPPIKYVSYTMRRIRRVVYDEYYGTRVEVSMAVASRQRKSRRTDETASPDGRTHRDPLLRREAEEILAAVRTLWKDLIRNPHADAEQYGMTGPQVTVMACLVGKGTMTLTELSRSLGMSHSSASGIVDRLESKGLVRRTEDARDRRRTSIDVTEAVRR